MLNFKGICFPIDVILICIRWYMAYPLSYRHLEEMMEERGVSVVVRQVKYLNNIVEQDHRAIKRVTKLMLGFKSFRCAAQVIAGVELMHMTRKDQFAIDGTVMSFASQCYALAGQVRPA